MPEPRFLQIHFLTPYVAALLNRDDTGLAKRLPYGGTMRTRISSQCLKYHWRKAEDVHSLHKIDGAEASFRSRETVDRKVFDDIDDPEKDAGIAPIREALLKAVYGDKGTEKKSRQTLLLGAPEIAYLRKQSRSMLAEAAGDAKKAKSIAAHWLKAHKANLKVLSQNAAMPGGLTAALFGRMVTSDPAANIDAPVYVAHAFSVHAEESEGDYFIAADDLAEDGETGADTIQETELTSGLFYGQVVVDLPGLLKNLGGDRKLAGEVLHNFLYLIAEVSPGAKRGSTAPFSRAAFLLLEVGDRQPRSLAEAYRNACAADTGAAIKALTRHLARLDDAYATDEERFFMALSNQDVPGATRGSLADLATIARGLPARVPA